MFCLQKASFSRLFQTIRYSTYLSCNSLQYFFCSPILCFIIISLLLFVGKLWCCYYTHRINWFDLTIWLKYVCRYTRISFILIFYEKTEFVINFKKSFASHSLRNWNGKINEETTSEQGQTNPIAALWQDAVHDHFDLSTNRIVEFLKVLSEQKPKIYSLST